MASPDYYECEECAWNALLPCPAHTKLSLYQIAQVEAYLKRLDGITDAVEHVRGVLAQRDTFLPADPEDHAAVLALTKRVRSQLEALHRVSKALDDAYSVRCKDTDTLSLRRIRELLGDEYLGGGQLK